MHLTEQQEQSMHHACVVCPTHTTSARTHDTYSLSALAPPLVKA